MQIIDNLHEKGLIYADQHRNAIFLRRDEAGWPTRAALRSISFHSSFKGLTRGTQRHAGYFYYETGQSCRYNRPSLVIAESPIDAMSIHAVRMTGQGQQTIARFLSTDGAGDLPFSWIDQAIERGWTVQAAFDNDHSGDLYWQKVRDHYPTETERLSPDQLIWREIPPLGKDWNDTLRQRLSPQLTRTPETHDDYSR